MNLSKTIRMGRLKHALETYETVMLYGAGDYALQMANLLSRHGISVGGCIVSDLQNAGARVKDLPVYGLEDCASVLTDERTVVLTAVSTEFEGEIEQALKRFHARHYLLLSDYSRSRSVFEQYRNNTREDYLAKIAEYRADQNFGLGETDPKRIVSELEAAVSAERKRDHIVFISNCLQPREVKIAKALKKRGYAVSVLVHERENDYGNGCLEILKRVCDEVVICSCVEELMENAIRMRPRVIHFFVSTSAEYPAVMMGAKELFAPCVFDKYDILNEMYLETEYVTKAEFGYEKICLELADGICNRGFEVEYLRDACGYKVGSPVLHFPDCIDRDEMWTEPSPSARPDDEPLQFCFAGSFHSEKDWPGAPTACFLAFEELCAENHCHFHMYPIPYREEPLSDYIERERESPWFHLHRPVPYDKLPQELSKYDYFIIPTRKTLFDSRTVAYNTAVKFVYGAANKLYDAFSAGLPLITLMMPKVMEECAAKHMVLRRGIEELDFGELRRIRTRMRESVYQNREDLLADNRIQDLIDFYSLLER